MTLSNRQILDQPADEFTDDQLYVRHRPVFTIALIALCVAASGYELLQAAGSGLMQQRLSGLAQAGALFGPYVAQGQWYRVITTVFLHAGLIHLFFNMSAAWSLGQGFELSIGSWRLALVSLVTALGAAAAVLAFGFSSPTVGASGVICGWLGAMLPISFGQKRRALLTIIVQIAVISLLPFVSWQGHLGGFLAGLGCGYALRTRYFPVLALILLTGFAALIVAAVQFHSGAVTQLPG